MSESLYQQYLRDDRLMKTAVDEMSKRGEVLAQAEAAYYSIKAQIVLQMRDEGFPVGIIEASVKGHQEVNQRLLEYRCAEALYKSASKAVDVYRDSARYTYDQLKREQSADEC